MFWTRFWIFGALITAILIGWYNVITNERLNEQYNFLKIVLPFFATIIALIQTLINRGAKRWLDYWEKKLENDFKDNNIYDKEKCLMYNKINYFSLQFSPAKLGIIFTDLVFLACLMLSFFEIKNYAYDLIYLNIFLSIIALLIVYYFFIMVFNPCFCKKYYFKN